MPKARKDGTTVTVTHKGKTADLYSDEGKGVVKEILEDFVSQAIHNSCRMRFKSIEPKGHQDNPRALITLLWELDTETMRSFGFIDTAVTNVVNTDEAFPIEPSALKYGAGFRLVMRMPGDPAQTELVKVSDLLDAKACNVHKAKLKGNKLTQIISVPLESCEHLYRLLNIAPLNVVVTIRGGK